MEDTMSAVARDLALAALPAGRPSLHLVPAGRPSLHLVPSAPPASRLSGPDRPMRISRFGRLLVTATVTCVIVVLATGMLGGGAAGPPAIDHAVTVGPAQTLSDIAAAELPRLPLPEGVARLQLANRMSTSEVHAGQQLLIPVAG
jgi:hypothetical protein